MNRLTQQHQKAQLALARATLRDLVRIWPAFDLNRIVETWPAVEEALLMLVRTRGKASSGIASRYYRMLREDNGVRDRFDPVLATVPEEAVLKGLQYVGPVSAGIQLAKGRPLEKVAEARFVDMAGTISRYVTNHGRETVMQSLQKDDEATGWRRITSGSACEFCRTLAARGVMSKESSVDFKSHNHCSCGAEPAYL